MLTIEKLIKAIKEGNSQGSMRFPGVALILRNATGKIDHDTIRLAYDYAKEAHKGQTRLSGEPYIQHSLGTAIRVAEMGLDEATIVAALLHDVPEDTNYTLVDVEKNFGSEVAKLVTGITKLGAIKYRGIERYAENLRKMFVSMADDIRIIIIKFADRIHNLSTLDVLPKEKQERIARESLEIYAPIAHRLGMGQIKGIIEDLAFRYVLREEYAWMEKEILPAVQKRKEDTKNVIYLIKKALDKANVKILEIHGREKRVYSLYRKLLRPENNRDPDKIYDLVAIRIIVRTVADCYNVLGIIHDLGQPLSGRIKDYIAQPKPNGYQSLHTTVFGPKGKIIEIQIRTREMHQQAEFGIAAHWHYKEGGARKKGEALPKRLKWVDDLVAWQKKIQDNEHYLQSLTIDVFQNRIFVFTPEGDVIDLPEDASPIDFAYHVHSWIGNHATGARVNHQMVSLDAKLKNGDMVDIITDKNRKGPSYDWLNFVTTGAAKNKIRSYLAKH